MLIPPFRARLDSDGRLAWPLHVVLMAVLSAALLGIGVALLLA